LSIVGATRLCGIVVKTSVFHLEPDGRVPQVADDSGFTRPNGHPLEPMTESRSAALLLLEQTAVIIEKPTIRSIFRAFSFM
jgi:hypothetical protein